VSSLLERWLRLQSGEGMLVLLFGGLMLTNALAMQVSFVASLSGFLKSDGLQVIWIVWLVDYGVFLLLAAIQSLIIDRFDRVTLMRGLLVAFTLAFAAVWLALQLGAPGRWVYGALYLVAEQQWMLFPLFFWVLASDAMSVAQAKRLFPLFASWGLVGKLLGLGIAAAAPALLLRFGIDLGHLLLLNIVMYLLSFVLLRRLRRHLGARTIRHAAEGFRAALTGGIDFIRDVPTFRYLAWTLLALMLIDTVVEFHFLTVTDAVFTSQASYQAFYGSYRIVLVTLAYGIQALATQRLLARMPLRQVLSLQPYVALTVLVGLLALPGLGSAVGALFLFRLVGETFHDSAKKALQGLVPEERRGRVSLVLESVIISLGTILGSVLIGALVITSGGGTRFDPVPVYLGVALTAAVAAAFAARRMRRTYESSLLSWRLARRQRTGASLLDKLL
jgi:ATP:ADP antiporter, AAA family